MVLRDQHESVVGTLLGELALKKCNCQILPVALKFRLCSIEAMMVFYLIEKHMIQIVILLLLG